MSVYNSKDAYNLYIYYLAIKRHFTSESYDFFKYNGKVNANPTSFETRKDKFFFYTLSKKEDGRGMILANVINDPNIWIGEIESDKCREIYQDWNKRKQMLSYAFKEELNELDDDFNSNIIVTDGQHPKLLKEFTRRRIGVETVIIIDELANCFRYWDKHITDTIVYPSTKTFCRKMRPFIKYDIEKMRKVVIDRYK